MLDDQVQRVYTWREVRAAMELDNRLLGTLLALFGVVGLVAAALALANAAGGRVLGQLRDLATLKSMGFTRGQVALLLLVEHGALGLLGVALGTLAGWAVDGGAARRDLRRARCRCSPSSRAPRWSCSPRSGCPPGAAAAPRPSRPPPRRRRAATCPGWPGSPCWYGCRPRSSSAPATPSPGGCPRS